jgi:hypothetical protein
MRAQPEDGFSIRHMLLMIAYKVVFRRNLHLFYLLVYLKKWGCLAYKKVCTGVLISP